MYWWFLPINCSVYLLCTDDSCLIEILVFLIITIVLYAVLYAYCRVKYIGSSFIQSFILACYTVLPLPCDIAITLIYWYYLDILLLPCYIDITLLYCYYLAMLLLNWDILYWFYLAILLFPCDIAISLLYCYYLAILLLPCDILLLLPCLMKRGPPESPWQASLCPMKVPTGPES